MSPLYYPTVVISLLIVAYILWDNRNPISLFRKLTSKKVATILFLSHTEPRKILGVSRRNNHLNFGLVGGKVEENEDLFQAAVRETKEEIGVDIDPNQLIKIHEDYMAPYWVVTYYYDGPPIDVKDHISDEDCAVKWISCTELFQGEFAEYNKNVMFNAYYNDFYDVKDIYF